MHLFTYILRQTSVYGERITRGVGTGVAWLTALLAVTTAAIVIVRVVFNWGTIGIQESLTYMHALIIMLASAYTLADEGHVRVDILYRHFRPITKAWVDALGTAIFLLPFALFMLLISWDYVATAWTIQETSADAGGIPAVYVLKSLIICNASLLLIQGVANLACNLITLTHSDTNQ